MRTVGFLGIAALSLTLLTPAAAQDPQPPQPLAKDVLGELLLAAQDKKLLQHRLFTKRYYKAEERRGQVVIVTGEGKETSEGIQIKLSFNVLSGKEKGSLTYHFNPMGHLQGLRIVEERGDYTKGIKVTIANGVATQQRMRDGQPKGDPRIGEWKGDMISLFSAIVLLPSLGDLGLKAETAIQVVREDDDIGRNASPRAYKIRREKPSKTAAGVETQVVWVEDGKRSRPMAKVILGTGKDQGVVREVLLDPKPDGRSDLHLTLITEKEVEELRKIAPLLSNEGKVQSALRSLNYAQRRFKQQKGGQFAASLEELRDSKMLYDKALAEGTSPGYLVMLRRSADGQAWMAVAVPEEPGKSGRYYYATGADGKTYRSKKAIQLEDSCKIPEGLELIR
jgi:hypothetical protein